MSEKLNKNLSPEFSKDENPLRLLLNSLLADPVVDNHILPLAKDHEVIAFLSQKTPKVLVPIFLGGPNVVGVIPIEKDVNKSVKLKNIDPEKVKGKLTEVNVVIGTVGRINELAEEALLLNEEKMRDKRKALKSKEKIKKEKWLHPYHKEILHEVDVASSLLGSGLKVKSSRMKDGGTLLTFHDQVGKRKSQPSAVNMSNVVRYNRLGRSKGKVREGIASRKVAGIYIPPQEVQDPEKIERAVAKIRTKMAPEFKQIFDQKAIVMGKGETPVIAVATEKQMGLWRNQVFFGELTAYREKGAPLTRLIRVMKRALGDRAELDIHHLNNGHEIDVVFSAKNPRYPGELATFTLPAVYKEKVVKVPRVAGIICVEDGLGDKERKDIARRARNDLRLVYTNAGGGQPNVLAVDRELLDFWESKLDAGETIIESMEQENREQNGETRKVEYAHSGVIEDVQFFMYEPGPSAIGARFMQIIVKYQGGGEERVTLDMGAQYADFHWQGLAKPSFEFGIDPMVDQIPYVPGLISNDLLLKEAQSKRGAFFDDIKNPYLMELFRNLSEEDFVWLAENYGGGVDITKLVHRLRSNSSLEHVSQAAFLLSHAHADHDGFAGVLSPKIPMITSTDTIPFMGSKFLNPNGYLNESLFRRTRETLFNPASREIIMPPLLTPEPYTEIPVGSGVIRITPYPVEHSIHGAQMYKISVYDQHNKPVVKALYTGDYRFGPMTERAFRECLDVQVLITDTTNIVPSSNKTSLKVTKEMMEERFNNIFKSTNGGLVSVELNWNNIEDAEMITRIAKGQGKEIFVNPRLATVLYLFQELDESSRRNNSQFNWRKYNPVPRLGRKTGVLPFIPPKGSRRTRGEKLLERVYGLVPTGGIGYKPYKGYDDSAMIVATNPNLWHILQGVNPKKIGRLVRSSYWLYDENDKKIARSNDKFARKFKIPYERDHVVAKNGNILPVARPSLHRSGHAKEEEVLSMIEMLYQEGSLELVIPIHGEFRDYSAREIQRAAGTRNAKPLKVVRRVAKGGWTKSLLK